MEEGRERVIRLSSDSSSFFKIAWSIISESFGAGKPMILAETCELFRNLLRFFTERAVNVTYSQFHETRKQIDVDLT